MKRKKVKAEFLIPAALVVVILGTGGVLVRPEMNPEMVLPSRAGDVRWDHALHARMKEYTCQVCHHTEHPGTATPRPCRDCHSLLPSSEALVQPELYLPPPPEETRKTESAGGENPASEKSGEQGPPAIQAFHAKCQGCHKAVKKGPVLCRDCHQQSFTGLHGTVTWDHRLHSRHLPQISYCSACHHKDLTAEEKAAWEAEHPGEEDPELKVVQTEADYRPCSQCHQPLAVLNVDLSTDIENHENEVHLDCAFCHSTKDPEVGVRSCTQCHPRMDPNPENAAPGEKAPPSLEQAVHKKCLECHNAEDPDLRPGMRGACLDCHASSPSLFPGDSAGPVIWSHNRHRFEEPEDFLEYKCDKCHHTDLPGEPHMACRRCHGTGNLAGIPNLEDAAHKRCIDCHEEKGKGPVECIDCHSETRNELVIYAGESSEGPVWWNHAFHADNLGLSCRECHHNMIKENGFPLTACKSALACEEDAAAPQACENCHASLEEPEPIKPGELPGGTVEINYGHTVGDMIPSNVRDALHTTCHNCHRKMGAGPLECKDCHVVPSEGEKHE